MEFKDVFSNNVTNTSNEKKFLTCLNYFADNFPDFKDGFALFYEEINSKGFYDELFESLQNFLINEVFSTYVSLDTMKDLSTLVTAFYREVTLHFGLNENIIYDEESGLYKVYPLDRYKYTKEANILMSEVLNTYFFNPNQSFEKLLKVKTSEYQNKNGSYKSNVKNAGLKPYYGEENYLMERIDYIIECIKIILDDNEVDNKVKIAFREGLDLLLNSYIEYEKLQESITSEHERYDALESFYKKVLTIENNLAPLLESVWNNYLTDPKDFELGKPFRFLVHSTNICSPSMKDYTKACATLVTDKCMPIPYGDVGYIMKYAPKTVDIMSTEDAGSWITDINEFIDRDFIRTWQLTSPDKPQSVFYESGEISKLILPSDMERKMLSNNAEVYGNTLNKCMCYTEVFFKKGDTNIENLGFFARTPEGMRSVSSLDSNLPKVFLDLKTYRIIAGLPPEEEKRTWY